MMPCSKSRFAVVDLFAGPGGLAEGFSAVTASDGSHPFHVVMSVEKDRVAHSTLLLRSFLRQFGGHYPQQYYDFLRTQSEEPDWGSLYPDQWRKAGEEAVHLELGSTGSDEIWAERIDAIRQKYGDDTVLIGGPPCQAYSLVGRARNSGIKTYKPEDDPKHFLYREYIAILTRLKPAAFVMENVKGMLSSIVDKKSVFERILSDLRSAGGDGAYKLVALAPRDGRQSEMLPREALPADFVVRGEDFGLPQKRHRVIVVGIRRDVYNALDGSFSLKTLLKPSLHQTNVEDVLDGMPKLRSGLSKDDGPAKWAQALQEAARTVSQAAVVFASKERGEFRARVRQCGDDAIDMSGRPRSASTPTGIGMNCPEDLKRWLLDPRLQALPNTRREDI